MNREALIKAATEARANAYAPYSVYSVGAAALSGDGRVFAGCNVENASYGLTVCAERNAVFTMVATGSRELKAIAVATEDGGVPCGACLQVMAEFGEDEMPVFLIEGRMNVTETTLGALLPRAFRVRKKK